MLNISKIPVLYVLWSSRLNYYGPFSAEKNSKQQPTLNPIIPPFFVNFLQVLWFTVMKTRVMKLSNHSL